MGCTPPKRRKSTSELNDPRGYSQSITDNISEFEDEKERLKRLVRNNNFTQQTNALDVDKHM